MGREIQVSNVEVRKIVGFIPSPFDMIYCLLDGHNQQPNITVCRVLAVTEGKAPS